MELQEFVYQTLRSISVGVTRAKHDVGPLTAIAPGKLNGESQHVVSEVQFDVAVTISENCSSSSSVKGEGVGRINVFAAKVDMSGGASGERTNTAIEETISRLSFSVPITLNAGTKTNDEPTRKEQERQKEILSSLEDK